MKNLWIALIVLLWLLLGWIIHQKYGPCCNQAEISTIGIQEGKILGPLLFKWGSQEPILDGKWSLFKDSLSAALSTNQVLEIIGKYCTEGQPEENENLGLKRAQEIRKLFPEIKDDKISMSTKSIVCDPNARNQNHELSTISIKIRTENIKEIDDRTLIYFPTNSTEKLNSVEVENYLNEVAKRVMSSGELVSLTGHSDNVGDADKNNILSQKRSDIIKQYLISKGVKLENITSKSEGETRPIEDNSTNDGRAKNRRTELQIIKSPNQK